jgi:hypothetical protein
MMLCMSFNFFSCHLKVRRWCSRVWTRRVRASAYFRQMWMYQVTTNHRENDLFTAPEYFRGFSRAESTFKPTQGFISGRPHRRYPALPSRNEIFCLGISYESEAGIEPRQEVSHRRSLLCWELRLWLATHIRSKYDTPFQVYSDACTKEM